MEHEAALLARMGERFPQADIETATTARHRIFCGISLEALLEALAYAKEELGFGHLCAITGLDTGDGFAFLYHIAREDGILMTLKCPTAGGDGVVIPSVLPIYGGATFYEKELEGMLGVRVEGLPEGRQYPLPDDWPAGQYPLRKDWKKQE